MYLSIKTMKYCVTKICLDGPQFVRDQTQISKSEFPKHICFSALKQPSLTVRQGKISLI